MFVRSNTCMTTFMNIAPSAKIRSTPGPFRRRTAPSVRSALTLLIALAPIVLQAQLASSPNRTQAIDTAESEAARRAEESASLSPEKLIELLHQEPGLLLEVKKDLFRRAFEQGAILESRDLNDEALFRLLREDESVRVLATQEVTRRFYIRVLPTDEERRREAAGMPRGGQKESQQTPARGTRNLEDRYWSAQGNPASSPETSPMPHNSHGGESLPKVDFDERRALERAGFDSDEMNDANTAISAPSTAGRLEVEDLPGLIRTGSERPLQAPRPEGDRPRNYGTDVDRGRVPSNETSLPMQEASSNQGAGNTLRSDLSMRSSLRLDYLPLRHRVNPYADVPSLYDMYAQYGNRPPTLARFAGTIFRNGTGNSDQLPMDLPVGLDYVLGPGDGLSINLSGGVSERLRRVVDREGRVALPESGPLQVSGRSLGDVQQLVQTTLQRQFRDVRAEVSLARLRSVRVYVVGDVERAGAYDISSLSTPLNAAFIAGGPTARGSLRTLRHYRGAKLVQEVDVYDLLLHGVRAGIERLQSGDTVLVPPLGEEITVEGMVRRPAIYEIHGEKNLAEVLALAGGVLTSGTLRHVDVERTQAHESRTMLRLDIPESNNQETVTKALEDFAVQDGDKIRISPILPYADKTVYLAGHVFKPGKYAYREGMSLTDLVQSYHDLLPEPSGLHAEIVRLNASTYAPQVIAFNLEQALKENAEPLLLQPFDTVRIFSRFDFEDPPLVTVAGEVRDPGDHLTNGTTRVRDAIYLAGGLTPDASIDSAQIFRRTGAEKLRVLGVNLKRALAGEEGDNLALEPKDRIA